MHSCLLAIFIIQKNKWKWLLMQWTLPWCLSAWPSARRWPARARTSASSSTSTLPFLSPWIPGRVKWAQLWERSGQALQLSGGMQEEEKSFWERSSTFPRSHLLLRILRQIPLPVQLLWQLQMQLPLLLLLNQLKLQFLLLLKLWKCQTDQTVDRGLLNAVDSLALGAVIVRKIVSNMVNHCQMSHECKTLGWNCLDCKKSEVYVSIYVSHVLNV